MIIGFVGKKRSGKTLSAWHLETLCERRGLCAVRHGFAKPLRDFCKLINLSDRQIYGDLKEIPVDSLGGKTPRQFMQLFGTEFGRRMIHDKFWIMTWMKTLPSHADVILVEDVRFLNEAGIIRSLGGVLVRVTRPVDTDAKADLHPSEMELMHIACSHDIRNDTNVAALNARLENQIWPEVCERMGL